jgi:hypothetical protein
MPSMKTNIIFALLTFVFAVSALHAQTKETRNVSTFKEISFRIPGKLFLTQGSVQKVEIEGNADALKKVEIEVDGDELTIEREGSWTNWGSDNEKFNVYITVKDIEGIHVGGSGNLVGQNKFTVANLDLDVSGSGSMQLEANASGKIDADVSGSGNIDFKGTCKEYSSDVSGSGKVLLAATIAGTADFDISGSGKIEVTGTAKLVKAGVTGSGKVLAANLVTDECNVRISGSGSVEINVKNSLDANITGSGSVSYKGNPNHVNGHSTGSGHVKKM